jgi:hypothetical protein|tara:strand:- start:1777 stop:2064 length:288 start_codon:yes stop_codon:yes gene_type:complete
MYKGITKLEFGTRSRRGKASGTGAEISPECQAVFLHLQPGKGIRIPHIHEKAAKGVCKLLNRLNVYRTTHNRLDIAMKHDKANNDLLVFNFEGDS